MVTRSEVLSIVIPQRLDAIATLNLVLCLRAKGDAAKPTKIYFADRPQITGSSSVSGPLQLTEDGLHC